MAELIETVQTWFFSLGDNYGVNPIIFGSIYVGAIPFFTLSIGWLVSNYRNEKSVVFPAISATFFFISAYLYLMIAGHNVPIWVYGIVILMIIYGAYSTFKNVKNRIQEGSES